MNIAQIRDRGQVTIPKAIRQQAGIGNATMVMIITEPGRIILEPVSITPYLTRDYTGQEIKQFINDDRLDSQAKEKVDKPISKR